MASYLITSVSVVLFSASEADVIWTNDDFEQLSDHRFISIVGQITKEATEVASALTPRMAPAVRVISVFQSHLLNPKEKEMMGKVLFQ
jgi:hypothetical protein